MPTESALPPPLSRTPSLWSPYKCDRCGARCVAGSATTSTAPLPPSPTSPRSLGGIGRSYSDTVRFGDNRSRSFTVDITVHPDNTESENVREHADAVAELGAMICGTCATATASAEPVSPEPLTALQGTGERTLAQSNGQGHGQVHAVSAVGLGLSLGRAVVTNVLEQHVECDPARPASVSSEDSISTPDLAKLDISPICPASAAATLPITSQTISSEAAKPSVFPQSLPTPGVLPWSTARPTPAATASNVGGTSRAGSSAAEPDLGRRYRGTEDRPYQPILDATSERISNTGRGALYPGSIFKGTQTSGRSAYDVEIRFLTVNLPYSTCSGYLTITNLTDTHPMLTTFFTAELIGEKYGFLTANRWGASEHDDLRHWGRFEQFRRAETRASLIRPELFLREPVGVMSPWRSGGGVGAASPQTSHVQGMPGLQGTGPTRAREECWADVKGKDRDFVFMRIKEHFLVPDHRVKDISGASFAGFYYAMLDLTPSGDYPSPTSPTSPRTALPAQSTTSATSPTSPHAARYSYVPSSATSYASNTNHDLRERLPRRQSNQAAAAIRPSAWARRVSGPGVHDDEPEPEPGPDADADGTPDEEDFGDPTGETEIRSGSGSGDLPALGAGSGGTSAGIAGYFSSAFGRRASTATSPGMDTGTGGSGSRGAANGHVLVGPPPAGRRSSSSVIRESDLQSPTANAVPPTGPQMPPRRRRESSHRAIAEAPREATIRGYYFHSLNQEPFQELFLTHVPSKSNGTFEMR